MNSVFSNSNNGGHAPINSRGNVAKKLIALVLAGGLFAVASVVAYVFILQSQLPKMITLADYEPLLVSEVFDRSGAKIGEFARENRTLVAYKDIPKILSNAFIAAEDSTFFQHGGINYVANLRAFLANLKAGEKVQGASTITQQVARSLMLSSEKTYARKIKEILLSYQMEKTLSKEDILYLYFNQIFLGQNSYGIAVACKTYFNKDLKDISLAEAAILAGLPKAPSELNPIRNPERAKERQRYVLNRMIDDKMITREDGERALKEPVNVYIRKNYWELAPHYLETVRQMLIAKIGEETVLDKGIKIYTGLDLAKQLEAQKQVQAGLRELDKHQGYRGPIEEIENAKNESEKIANMLLAVRNDLLEKQNPYKVLQANGTFPSYGPLNLTGFAPQAPGDKSAPKLLPVLPTYVKPGDIVKAVVIKVDDEYGLTQVRFAESKGMIDIESMKWARKPDPTIDSRYAPEVTKPSTVLKKGDIIEIKVVDDEFHSKRLASKFTDLKKKLGKKFKMPENLPNFKEYAQVELEQTPETEASLFSIDQNTNEIIALVGSYDYNKSKLNRVLQTARQTGSSFKTIVYAAALDKNFTPATLILDAPIVFEEEEEVEGNDNKEMIIKKWKPTNDSNRFVGDILFRNALIRSLNVPSVKIIEKVGVDVAIDYARRMGIFSPLNNDFTLVLGSSSVTLYEMTKMFAQIGQLGKRVRPLLIHRVEDKDGKTIQDKVFLDERFEAQLKPLEEDFEARRVAYLEYQKAVAAGKEYTPAPPKEGEAATKKNPAKEPPIFFADPDQLMRPETAFVMTSLLEGVVAEKGGTGGGARGLGRPAAGKTGTTSQYYDAWFIGYTPDIATGVWVGYDHERTLGKNEVGARAALPIWLEYMKFAHEGLPVKSFNTPDGIVFASIDNDTGKLASSSSKDVVRQAFIAGTEPKELQDDDSDDSNDTQDFYKEDLSD